MIWISRLTAALLCATLLTSCGSKSGAPSVRETGQGGPMSVNGVVVTPQPLDNLVRSSGTVLASESVDLVAEASGRTEKILFREGAHVTRGDLLVKINDDDLQAQLRKTELQIQLASDQEGRQQHLFEIDAISREQYDVSINQVNTLKADRDNLLAAIRKREIRAPFDGRIGLRFVSEGSYVTPSTRIASVQKVNPLKVDFAIPERYATLVALGDRIECSSQETQLTFSGKLYAVEPRVDPATGTVQLRALCDNSSEKIFPGAFVHIELRLKQIVNALMVPTQAIIPVLKGQTVLVRRNGVVASVPVKTGIRTPSSVQIVDGLSPGDTVITTGILQLRPGMPVNVTIQ
jgi:membrane fusion protein (multidrug efflux system)